MNFAIEPRSSNPHYLKLFFVYLRIWVTGVLQNIQKRVLSVKRKSALKRFNRERLLTNILYMQKTGFYKKNNNYYYCFCGQSSGFYYACATYMKQAFVWTSTESEWNKQNTIWSCAFGLPITRNLITRVLTRVTWNFRKAQWWSKSVLTFDHCRPHSITFGNY